MTELEQLKQELQRLTEKVEELEKQEEQERQKSGYPKVGEIYYYVAMGDAGKVVQVGLEAWSDCESDLYYWNFCHGSTDENKVKWTIKHIELINEIKKYTRPFKNTHANWYFVESHYTQFAKEKTTINIFETSVHDHNSEYGYFGFEGDAKEVIEQFSEEYILKFLFEPTDGDYKAVMDWLADQEEQDDKPF